MQEPQVLAGVWGKAPTFSSVLLLQAPLGDHAVDRAVGQPSGDQLFHLRAQLRPLLRRHAIFLRAERIGNEAAAVRLVVRQNGFVHAEGNLPLQSLR